MTDEQIIRLYGKRCAEYCPECCVCEVWAMHDLIETQAREIERLRIALHEIDIEAANTIPPDGKDAAFAALFRIAQIINPFRLPRAALAGDSHDQ